MKKFFAILAATVLCVVSCTKLGIPTVEFANVVGNFYVGAPSNPVAIRVNIAQDIDCKVTVKATYIKLTEEVESKDIEVVIPAGEREAYAEIPNSEDEGITTIRLTLNNLPAGFIWGGKLVCLLTPTLDEPVVYTFVSETANLHESLKLKVNLTGMNSGKDWKASSTMQFKAIVKGATDSVSADDYFVVEEGESSAVLIIKTDELFDAEGKLYVSIAPQPGLIAGDQESCTVSVMGLPTAKTLAGTWSFSELIDAEEMELWYMEMEDDFSLCPAKNEGFQLTIAEKDGALTLTPNTTGDFAKYFRTATMTLCEPVNPVAKSVNLGKYTADEGNMFVSEVYMPYQQSIFYELSSVNRSFDTTEKLGKGAMSIAFIDADSIIVTIRDYDEPPFGFMWWDTTFDPEMLGFASVFTRK